MAARSTCIGIDLGTTYSCVGVWKNDRVEIIANEQGSRTTPSYVAFTEADRLIGEAAKNQAIRNIKNTVFDAKRLIGRKFSDSTVQSCIKKWPFRVVSGSDDRPQILVEFRDQGYVYHPEEISSMILGKMKETAQAYLGRPVNSAVVTVPAYFNDSQRQATKDAGTIAGLNVERIINEPTAAAIAYGFSQRTEDEKNVLIFDLGGGTFDVTILAISDGIFEVLATGGDTHLGGQDFDNRMLEYCIEDYNRRFGKDISTNMRAKGRILNACERAKRTLSSASQASIEIDSLLNDSDYSLTITRSKFEELNQDFFNTCLDIVNRVLTDSRLTKSQIHEIVMVGGSTRIMKIQQMIREFFNGKDINLSLNPDEAVAYGATIQGSILSGEENPQLQGVLLIDVTPLSLGVQTVGGVMNVVVPRNSKIPTKKTNKGYSTSEDNQTKMNIRIYEGERPLTADNHRLGNFMLEGITPAPQGVPRVDITFEIDANGITHVTAVEKGSGNSKEIRIINDKGRLSSDEIQQLIAKAEFFKREDADRLRRVQARNRLEGYVLNLRHCLSLDSASFIHLIDRKRLRDKIEATLIWLENSNASEVGEYDERVSELEAIAQPMIKSLTGN